MIHSTVLSAKVTVKKRCWYFQEDQFDYGYEEEEQFGYEEEPMFEEFVYEFEEQNYGEQEFMFEEEIIFEQMFPQEEFHDPFDLCT